MMVLENIDKDFRREIKLKNHLIFVKLWKTEVIIRNVGGTRRFGNPRKGLS